MSEDRGHKHSREGRFGFRARVRPCFECHGKGVQAEVAPGSNEPADVECSVCDGSGRMAYTEMPFWVPLAIIAAGALILVGFRKLIDPSP